MVKDEQWPVARLIPISSASGVEAQERRAASALLAVIGAVDEFGKALLRPLGAPAGKVETFIEIPFKLADGRSLRPDGIISVTRGAKSWKALVEVKVGPARLEREQIDAYLDLARELNFDAVLSISNHYVTSSNAYPIEVDKRKSRKVELRHWSWIDVVTEAVVQRQHKGISDPDQAYILNELIRYFEDPRSGAAQFEGMGPSWTTVKEGARAQTLRKNDDHVAAITARWDELVRYVGLQLTQELGKDIRQVLPKEERTPASRDQRLRETLATSGQLYAELQVPNAAGPLRIVADLRSRQILVSTQVQAPREGRTKGRVSWMLRQLQAAPDNLVVESWVTRSTQPFAAPLSRAREDPTVLYPEATKEIRQFRLVLSNNMGLKRDRGKGSFIDSVRDTTEEFYRLVLQNLRPWKASPPKLRKKEEEEGGSDAPDVPEEIEGAVEDAREEMTGAAES